jgi:hypothetical protein
MVVYDAITDIDVRNRLSEIIELDEALVSYRRKTLSNLPTHKEIFNRALDNICSNIVGNTMFKLLLVKVSRARKIHLVNYDEGGSLFSPKDYAVKINLSLYDSEGVGIPSRQYYYIKEDGALGTKLKSLSGSIFHELVHGLHYVSEGQYANTVLCQDGSAMKEIWSKDEELRTITGYMYSKPYDPICDHIFDYSLHGAQFCPRYGHLGWQNGCDRNPPILVDNLADQMVYLKGWNAYELPDPLPLLTPPQVLRKIQSRVGRHRPPRKPPILPVSPAIRNPQIPRKLPKL